MTFYPEIGTDDIWIVINLLDYKQGTGYDVGLHEWKQEEFSQLFPVETDVNLQEFQVYTLIREKDNLSWLINEKEVMNYSYTGLEPDMVTSLSQNMQLHVYIIVSGENTEENQQKSITENWSCPSFIVDWVKVYKINNDTSINSENSTISTNGSNGNSEESASNICAKVKQIHQNETKKNVDVKSASSYTFVYYLVPLVLVFVIVIAFLVWMVMKQGKQIQRIDKQGENIYDHYDIGNEVKLDEHYDEVDYRGVGYEQVEGERYTSIPSAQQSPYVEIMEEQNDYVTMKAY